MGSRSFVRLALVQLPLARAFHLPLDQASVQVWASTFIQLLRYVNKIADRTYSYILSMIDRMAADKERK